MATILMSYLLLPFDIHSSVLRTTTGLSVGLLSFTFLKLFPGRRREISPLIWVLSVLFLLRYIFLGGE